MWPTNLAGCAFAGEVARRLSDDGSAARRLLALAVPYRTDQLFALGADLHDALALYRDGRVSESVVREAALAIAVEVGQLWLVTTQTTHPPE